MDDARTLRRDLGKIQQAARILADKTQQLADTLIADIIAVNAKTQRAGQLIDPLAVGFTTIPITWPNPFPDTAYMVIPVVSVPVANMGQVFVTAGQKTTDGCTVVVRNTSAVTPAVVLDVLGIRT